MCHKVNISGEMMLLAYINKMLRGAWACDKTETLCPILVGETSLCRVPVTTNHSMPASNSWESPAHNVYKINDVSFMRT